ncbi:MAG TPA: PspC domain-containing protein [Candidatus Limnocylindrales bacterium]|nr:PspC domain-containing protein [Candidatus Limnocylindrales bacterium]
MSDRLYRSRNDRMLAGVAGGLAEMWDADPSLVRIVWALLVVLTGGIALVVYIVMAIVVPEEDDAFGSRPLPGTPPYVPPPPPMPGNAPEEGAPTAPMAPADASAGWAPQVDARTAHLEAREARRAARRADRAQRGPGIGPMLIGSLLVLLGVYFLVREYIPSIDWNWFWPLVLVGLGVFVLVMAIDRGPRNDGTHPGDPGNAG